MELTIDQALQQGIAAHKEGKLQEAEKLYKAIIVSQPDHPDANHNLGLLNATVGKVDNCRTVVSMSDVHFVELIENDKIDILMDLTGNGAKLILGA